jgi:phage protein U
MATWGTTLRGFRCVIESLSTKNTMFDSSGKPLRATCTVKLKEADSVKAKGSK